MKGGSEICAEDTPGNKRSIERINWENDLLNLMTLYLYFSDIQN